MRYLLDTNVVSELRKGRRANPGVSSFIAGLDEEMVFLAVHTIGELRRGMENIRSRGDLPQANRLEAWLDVIVTDYAARILAFDLDCAQIWGAIMSPHPQHPIDKQIAAIALLYDLTVVTRNTNDFRHTGTRVLNPFT